MSAPVLKVTGLEVQFPGLVGSTRVLHGIDLSVDAGDILGLVGESGCGKSMTALACLGMVPRPGQVSGSVQVGGCEIVGQSASALGQLRGSEVAMVFQNPMRSLNPFFTIGQQMTEVISCHMSCNKAEARSIAVRELTAVHMPDPQFVLGKYPHQLSGGQIQRVMISLALACRPKLLIADEPTTALDVTVQAQIIALLRELADKAGLTVLFITHDLGVVSQLCNRVSVMYAGRVVEAGSVAEVIDDPRHPYTSKLLGTVPTVGGGRQNLESIPGQVPSPRLLPEGCAFQDRCEFGTSCCWQVNPEMRSLTASHEVACHHPGVGLEAAMTVMSAAK